MGIFSANPVHAQNTEISGKVKRLAKQIASTDVLMVGRDAILIDESYQRARQDPFFDEQGNFGSNVAIYPRRNIYSRQPYNISFNKYQYYYNQRALQVRRFRDLTNKATIEELVTLTDYTNGVVRCYAFCALLEQHYKGSFEILKKHLSDSEMVMTFDDEDGREYMVGDFFLMLMTEGKINASLLKLTEEQLLEIDEILLNDDDVVLETQLDRVMELEATEENYKKIRAFAEKKRAGKTLVKLSEYQKEEDVRFIKRLFDDDDPYYALKAVRNFPHPDFFEGVKAIHDKQISKKKNLVPLDILMLYQALAQYKTEESKQMMQSSIQETKKFLRPIHTKYVWLALHKYPAPVFDDFFNQIRLSSTDRREVLEYLEY